jgi:tripartite-type tricarboxylate transporter receptor subunit TctC
MKFLSRIAAVAMAFALAVDANAQTEWPKAPVRLIVSFGAGGTSDALGRFVAQKLGDRWGRPVNVDNRPGGHTFIGATEAARAAPDGHTLFLPINSTLTMNPFAVSKLPYDPHRDFTHIAMVAKVLMIYVSNDTLPVKTMPEFVAYAKAHPGDLTIGYSSVISQVGIEQFARDWGLKLRLVPYKSGIEITKALLSGDIQAGFDGIAQYPPLLKSGKLRGLATTGAKRVDRLEGLPSLGDVGLNKVEIPVWYGIMGPAGMPTPIRDKIAADVRAIMATPEARTRLSEMGMAPDFMAPEAFTQQIRSESAIMAPLVHELGIKLN